MLSTLMIFQGILSVLMIIIVLLQFGKGAEAGLMGGGSDAVMTGGQRGNFFTKLTTVIAILFLSNSIILARLQSNHSAKSLLDNEAPVARALNNDALRKEAEKAEKNANQKEGVTTTPAATQNNADQKASNSTTTNPPAAEAKK